MSCPRIDDGCAFAIASSVLLLIASTKPSPRTLRLPRSAVDVGVRRQRRAPGVDVGIARSWISDPPGCSMNDRAIEEAGALLHDLAGAAEDRRQMALAAAGGIEDRPEAVGDASRVRVNSSTAASKLHSSSGIIGELGESVNAACLAQNSSAKPLDATANPVGASLTPCPSTAYENDPTNAAVGDEKDHSERVWTPHGRASFLRVQLTNGRGSADIKRLCTARVNRKTRSTSQKKSRDQETTRLGLTTRRLNVITMTEEVITVLRVTHGFSRCTTISARRPETRCCVVLVERTPRHRTAGAHIESPLPRRRVCRDLDGGCGDDDPSAATSRLSRSRRSATFLTSARVFVSHHPLRALPGQSVTIRLTPDLRAEDGAVLYARRACGGWPARRERRACTLSGASSLRFDLALATMTSCTMGISC